MRPEDRAASAGWAEVQAQLDRPVTRLLSRVVTALAMDVRLSFAELQRVANEAAEREDHLEKAYAQLTCPLLVVLAAKADPVPQGEAMRAAVDTAATRLQQRHPQVKLAWLPCVTRSHWSGPGSWPTSLSASLNPQQFSSEFPLAICGSSHFSRRGVLLHELHKAALRQAWGSGLAVLRPVVSAPSSGSRWAATDRHRNQQDR